MMPAGRRRSLIAALAVALVLALPAVANAAYGAIAVNQGTGMWGISYDAPAKSYAERQALRACAGQCSVAVWVRNRCAAVVYGRTHFVAGIGTTQRDAIDVARGRAHKSNARVLAWVCSG